MKKILLTILLALPLVLSGCKSNTQDALCLQEEGTSDETRSRFVFEKPEDSTSELYKDPTAPVNVQDSLALVALYNATNGQNWHRNSGWLSQLPVYKWEGVQVMAKKGENRVTVLRIGGNNLKGSLPKELGHLTELRVLDLTDDYALEGSIPEEIYNLKQLRVLKVVNTNITGQISERIGNLYYLDSLDLRTGKYWLEDSKIASDKKLGDATTINQIKMTGEIPVSIGYLENLTYFNVRYQGFSGKLPEKMGDMYSLKELELSYNNFEGEIPASFGDLKHLRLLYMSGNKLSGKIPAELFNATNLYELYISDNKLSGELPSTIGQLKKVSVISFSGNQLSGSIPAEISMLPELALLYLDNNQFSGDLPVGFAGKNQPYLIRVTLENNNLTGNIPVRVQRSFYDGKNPPAVVMSEKVSTTGYTIFQLAGNRFTGTVSKEYLDYPETLHFLLPQQEGFRFDNLH